jgi:Ca2+/Na+ antiporter
MHRSFMKTATTVALVTALAAISAPVVAAQVASNDFNWGDAAIGAAATLVLLIVRAGAALVSRRRRDLRAAER